jgi:hypothetical protein
MSNVCCKCYLIDEGCLRAYGGFTVGKGVTFDRLQGDLIVAHELDLVDAIGADCINELCEAKANNELTAIQTELIEQYITPFIAFIVEYYHYNGNVKHTAAGAVLMQGESYSQPTGKQIENAVAIAKRKIERYKERLVQFLLDNKETFTCFETDCLPCDDIVGTKYNNRSYGNIKGT